jgi:hypothetical protein
MTGTSPSNNGNNFSFTPFAFRKGETFISPLDKGGDPGGID